MVESWIYHRSSKIVLVTIDITKVFAQARKLVRTMRTCLIFHFSKFKYIPLLIRQIRHFIILRNRRIAVTTIASIAVLLAISTVYSNSEILEAAYAGCELVVCMC